MLPSLTYVGLTDDLERSRAEHGYPIDWQTEGPFEAESAARAWQARFRHHPGVRCSQGRAGWRHGYTFTITPTTRF